MINRTGQISIIASLLLAIGISTVSAQFIDNRLNLYAGYSLGSFHGPQKITDGEFQYPALYPNLKTLHGPGMGLMWGLTDHLYIGLGMQHLTGDQWNLESETLYAGTTMAITSLQPVLQYISGREETRLVKLLYTISVSPAMALYWGLPMATPSGSSQQRPGSYSVNIRMDTVTRFWPWIYQRTAPSWSVGAGTVHWLYGI